MAGNIKLSIDEQSGRLVALEEDVAQLREGVAQLREGVAQLREDGGRLRKLLARAYEGTPHAAAALLDARRDPRYEEAYADEPLISVRIGAYRGGDLLFERALRSVREQTYSNLEVIVVCDGRDEETVRRVEAIGDPRLRALQRPRNGPYPDDSAARWQVAGSHPFNQAVSVARGAWIAPIDQDDEWCENHLEVLLDTAWKTRAEVAFGVGRAVLDDGTETYFGAWPPVQGDFAWQLAIYHVALAPFLYDVNSFLLDEPADWNLARRMLEAGVLFDFVETVVTNYFVNQDERAFQWWKDRERERGAFKDPGAS